MDNLIIYQKIYDFTLYLFPIVDRFPKFFRNDCPETVRVYCPEFVTTCCHDLG